MLLIPLIPLAFLALTAGQDTTSTDPTTSDVAPTEASSNDGFTAPPVQDPNLPWNVTYFIAPTRNNYWVNDAVNSAKWTPVNVPSNLMLSNSNARIAGQRVVLAQNIASGTGTWTGMVTGYNPGNNYMLQLTAAGNPDQKFAQSQGFWIKPNGTAMAQQVTGSTPLGSGPAPGSIAPGGLGTPSNPPALPDAAPAPVPNYVPGSTSGASNSVASVVYVARSFVVAAGLAFWL
ncbi:hypothetical protein CspeluHIS016_0501090 [Cutaneotrichosporon spelunceum]|uniref:Ser-Thr-rich glycosyl-phosphatidyl-inositol-anchored membrane family-domain-containing protein n=1 Tax=Cutaneotrichosporon spelunceum TaxID=1672016 RepID=A0AAD3TX65_9TREE|nr:hypothetical protein CspeluHIS016_0501090 [Cutaneotrichosporon spelunceum]